MKVTFSKYFVACMVVMGVPLAYALPNPATLNCTEKGGVSQVVRTPDGEVGMCQLGEGSIDEWTLYDKQMRVGEDRRALAAFLNRDRVQPAVLTRGNPADLYCEQVGGKAVTLESANGESSLCQFQDGSSIDSWTLFRGPKDEMNQKLVAALES